MMDGLLCWSLLVFCGHSPALFVCAGLNIGRRTIFGQSLVVDNLFTGGSCWSVTKKEKEGESINSPPRVNCLVVFGGGSFTRTRISNSSPGNINRRHHSRRTSSSGGLLFPLLLLLLIDLQCNQVAFVEMRN